jgi:GAF domain-containing protein
MARRAKPSKGQAEAKRPPASKSPKNEGSKLRDLEKRLAEAHEQLRTRDRELVEAREQLTAAQVQVTESHEQQTATSEILRVISNSPTDVQPVFKTILAKASSLCGATLAMLLLYDGEFLTLAAHQNASPHWLEHMARFRARPGRESAARLAALERTTVHVRDILNDPRFSSAIFPLYQREGARTILAVPMLRETTLVGVIVMWRHDPCPFTDKQIELVETFAHQAVIAIENVRLFKELEARNRDLTTALDRQTTTADVLRIIAQSPTELQPVLDAIARSAVRLCAASDAVIERLEGDHFYNAAHAGAQMKGLVGLPLPLTRRFPGGRAVLDRKPVILDDIQLVAEHEYPDTLELLKLNTVRSVAEIPMLSEGKPLGSIAVLRAEVRPFTDAEVSLLKTFADQAVIAIENVRLFKELEARNRDLTEALDQQTATSEILRVISSSPTELQPVLDAVAENAARACGANDAHVYRVEGNMARRVAHYGTQPILHASDARPLQRDTLVGRAIVEGRTIHIPDVVPLLDSEYPGSKSTAGATGSRTILVTPLLREGVPIGAILIRRTEVRPFSDKQIQLLQTFTDQAVIAIENVRLFTELQEKNRALITANAQVTETLEQQTATG